jgi:hypothetical protein
MRETFGNSNNRCFDPSTKQVPPPADAPDTNRRQEADYKQPFEELWREAGPAVLDALDAPAVRFPKQIDMRLRDWVNRVTSPDPVPALDLAVLDRAFRDLSTLHLGCYTYSLDPHGAAGRPPVDRLVMTDRGYAFGVSRAQLCVAQIAYALHGTAGAQTILAAVGRERSRRRQIADMIGSLCH